MNLFRTAWAAPLIGLSLAAMVAMPANAATKAATSATAKPAKTMKTSHKAAKLNSVASKTTTKKASAHHG